MRADRPSLTATLVAGVRALYAGFPPGLQVAPDPHAVALVPPVLAAQARASAAAPWAAPFVHHALGVATVGLSWHVALRTLAIDDAVTRALAGGTRQVVLLGAGLDNRASRLVGVASGAGDAAEAGDLGGSAPRVFEVDHPDMQREKRARLGAAGLHDDGRVFVPVNFETDRLEDALVRAGLDRGQRSFWIWEGVTPYLTRDAVEGSLRAVASLAAIGSRVALTYMRPAADMGHVIDRLASFLGGAVGEHLRSQYHREEMASILGGVGLAALSDESDTDLAGRYWGGSPSVYPRSLHLFPEWERLLVAERVAA